MSKRTKGTTEPVIIELGGSNQLRVEEREYKGKKFVDIRRYYFDIHTQQYEPTSKGVTFPPDKRERVIEALQQLD